MLHRQHQTTGGKNTPESSDDVVVQAQSEADETSVALTRRTERALKLGWAATGPLCALMSNVPDDRIKRQRTGQ